MTGKPGRSSAAGAASRVIMVLLSLTVLLAAGAYALWHFGIIEMPALAAQEVPRVLIVAASPDDTGAVVGQIIVVFDMTHTPATIEAVSPALGVSIPGTTYSTLGDAYPFGGGKGTAEALARARGEDTMPYIAVDTEGLTEALRDSDGAVVELPADVNVFDGEELYVFEAGTRRLSGEDLQAVLKGAPYLTSNERAKLDAELARALTTALAASPDAVAGARTDLDQDELDQVVDALATVR